MALMQNAGVTNAINNYRPDAGFSHMLGNFAAGYLGSAVGLTDGPGGFFTGGLLTGMNDLAHGKIDNEYRLLQSFVGGGLSALAGKSFHESVSKKWGLTDKATDVVKKKGMDRFTSNGLQNVAANFAYDKDQEFFEKPFAIHAMMFMVGGLSAELQAGIMGGKRFDDAGLTFAKRFVLSMISYGAEYSVNYYFKTKMQYVKYGAMATIKQLPLLVVASATTQNNNRNLRPQKFSEYCKAKIYTGMTKNVTIADEVVMNKIYQIRGYKVMLDMDLAELYRVETKQLKRAVKRNIDRFPEDFMFELNDQEFENLRSQFGASSWGGVRYAPMAFTEQGVAMLSSVLNSKQAIAVNIQIIRVFTKMRQMLMTNKDILLKLEKLERKAVQHEGDTNYYIA
jgi:hypothetical protein